MRSSPKFNHEPVAEFFYVIAGSGADDGFAGGDNLSAYHLFDFPEGMDPELIDEHNNSVDVESRLNASEIVMLCVEMDGAILKETTDGFVSVDLYKHQAELNRDWEAIVAATSVNTCIECSAESEEYGADAIIEHRKYCSQYEGL